MPTRLIVTLFPKFGCLDRPIVNSDRGGLFAHFLKAERNFRAKPKINVQVIQTLRVKDMYAKKAAKSTKTKDLCKVQNTSHGRWRVRPDYSYSF